MADINDVANWILFHGSKVNNKKLQKLMYYSYAWYLVIMNERWEILTNKTIKLFNQKFEAWIHGPTCPTIYYKYKGYTSFEIDKPSSCETSLNPDEIDVLQQVLDVYDLYTGKELESISHQEKPWIEKRVGLGCYEASNEELSDLTIFDYYSSQME
jgi:uncharacterized phage-associated protein